MYESPMSPKYQLGEGECDSPIKEEVRQRRLVHVLRFMTILAWARLHGSGRCNFNPDVTQYLGLDVTEHPTRANDLHQLRCSRDFSRSEISCQGFRSSLELLGLLCGGSSPISPLCNKEGLVVPPRILYDLGSFHTIAF